MLLVVPTETGGGEGQAGQQREAGVRRKPGPETSSGLCGRRRADGPEWAGLHDVWRLWAAGVTSSAWCLIAGDEGRRNVGLECGD